MSETERVESDGNSCDGYDKRSNNERDMWADESWVFKLVVVLTMGGRDV